MRMYEENKDAMADVLAADLRKPKQEAIVFEIDFLINDLTNTLINLEKWAAVEKVKELNLTSFKNLKNLNQNSPTKAS